LGLRYLLAVPYYVSARVTAEGALESVAAIVKALAPSAWHQITWAQRKRPTRGTVPRHSGSPGEKSRRTLAAVRRIADRWRTEILTSATVRRPPRCARW
jgi:hypothetical protein